MSGFACGNILRSFALLSLFLKPSVTDRPLKDMEDEIHERLVSNMKNEGTVLPAVIVPKHDRRRVYEARVFENGVSLVVIQSRNSTKTIVRVSIKWGVIDGRETCKQIGEFLSERFSRKKREMISPVETKVDDKGPFHKRKFHINHHLADYTYYELFTKREDFKEDFRCFLNQFDIGPLSNYSEMKKKNFGITIPDVLKKIDAGELLSSKELEFWWENIFLRSKIAIVACGNIAEAELKDIYFGTANIRSIAERTVSADEMKSKEKYSLKNFTKLDIVHFIPGCCYMALGISYNNPFMKTVLDIIFDAMYAEDKNGICGAWADYGYHVKTVFESKLYGNLILIGFTIRVKNGMYKDYEKILVRLTSYLGNFKMSKREYRDAVESRRRRLEFITSRSTNMSIVEKISSSLLYYPVEYCLSSDYEVRAAGPDLGYEMVNRLLEEISNIERWEISISSHNERFIKGSRVSLGVRFRIKKEASIHVR